MSARRRRVRDRIARDRKRAEDAAKFAHSMKCVQRAMNDAIARGEKQITPRLLREMGRHLLSVR